LHDVTVNEIWRQNGGWWWESFESLLLVDVVKLICPIFVTENSKADDVVG